MAAYRQVYGFGHLQAECQGPGSAREPYARFEYETTYALHVAQLKASRDKKNDEATKHGLDLPGLSRPALQYLVSVLVDEVDVGLVFGDEVLDDGRVGEGGRQQQRNLHVVRCQSANLRCQERLNLGLVAELGRQNVTHLLDVAVFDGGDQIRTVRSFSHSRGDG